MKKIIAAVLSVFILSTSITAFGAVSDSTNHWANEVITNADAEGWLDVKEGNLFYPNNNATRQEVVYMVYSSQLNRQTQLEITAGQSVDGFSDSSEINDKYKASLEVLFGNGLIKGYNDGSFKPNGDITRAEAAVIISQLIGDAQLTSNFYGFNDELPAWAKINIERCARAGIISGYNDNTFKANDNVTRAELVSMLYKLNEFNASAVKSTTTETTTVKVETTTETVTETTSEETTETTTVIPVDKAKAEELLQSLNNERTEEGINLIHLEDELNEIAMLKAVEMAEKNIDDPVSPTYGTIEKMLNDKDVKYTAVVQFNVAGVTTGEDVISNLLFNQDKYDIMMTANYERAGIGYYNSRWCVIYVK